MNTDAIESMVRDVLSRMNSLQDGATPAPAAPTNDTARQPKVSDYPLATRHPEWVKTATNKTLDDLTLENVLSDRVTAQDMRITPETLRMQAAIAQDAGRDRLAMNFERAAELTAVPDDRIPCAHTVPPRRSYWRSLMTSSIATRPGSVPPLFGKRPGCTSSVRN